MVSNFASKIAKHLCRRGWVSGALSIDEQPAWPPEKTSRITGRSGEDQGGKDEKFEGAESGSDREGVSEIGQDKSDLPGEEVVSV